MTDTPSLPDAARRFVAAIEQCEEGANGWSPVRHLLPEDELDDMEAALAAHDAMIASNRAHVRDKAWQHTVYGPPPVDIGAVLKCSTALSKLADAVSEPPGATPVDEAPLLRELREWVYAVPSLHPPEGRHIHRAHLVAKIDRLLAAHRGKQQGGG